MDPRLYIYELRRPRVKNPTFNSSLVDNTCFSIYHGGPITSLSSDVNNNIQMSRQASYSGTKELNKEDIRSRGSSHLSNYGSNLMRIDDKDIYRKQNQRFNIISMQPIEHQETIKKYPKLTLEDKDAFYYKKVMGNQLHKQQQKYLKQSASARYAQKAGVHTYEVDKNKLPLNVWQSYGGPTKNHQYFSPKMLNHADQFRSLM